MKKLFWILTICLVAQFLFMSKQVSYGDSISQLEKGITTLKEENNKLELSIASRVAYSSIAQRAAEAGFTQVAEREPQADFSVALRH